MNYGYAPTKFDKELAEKLAEMLKTVPPDKHGMKPYIEFDGLYDGVRIRRITHYPKNVIDYIVKAADEIYESTCCEKV